MKSILQSDTSDVETGNKIAIFSLSNGFNEECNWFKAKIK